MNLSEYRNRLSSVAMILDLPEPMRTRVSMIFLWVGQPARFSPGDCIFVQGDEDENTGCVLLRGEVDVIRAHETAIPVVAPELLGEMQQLEPTAQRTATIQAVTEVESLLFSWHDVVAYAGMLLTSDEQLVLRDIIRKAAARRQET
ncbi:MAG: cyclic nucleotide-binding domain-containing protein [Candidatus Hydrogenedentes bacterium]|nr:cyclic nucleotide-binding domain-containing protein [Candidatus Hydrogenedentota bacterium]